METKVVSFDFDGVLVADSDAVFKKEAWEKVLAFAEGRYEPFLEEGKGMFGSGKPGGRVDILQHVFRGLGIPTDAIPGRAEEAARVFDEYVQAKILGAGLVPGAMETLEELSRRGVPLYLNSGTPTSALTLTARNLDISRFFAGILGSTAEPQGGSKVHNLRIIKEKEAVVPTEILFVGDSDSDAQAAAEFGCRFLGVSNRWNGWEAEGRAFPLVADLRDVMRYL